MGRGHSFTPRAHRRGCCRFLAHPSMRNELHHNSIFSQIGNSTPGRRRSLREKTFGENSGRTVPTSGGAHANTPLSPGGAQRRLTPPRTRGRARKPPVFYSSSSTKASAQSVRRGSVISRSPPPMESSTISLYASMVATAVTEKQPSSGCGAESRTTSVS